MSLSTEIARTADRAHTVSGDQARTSDIIVSVAPAQPEIVEMVHIRTFSFDPYSTEDLDAFLLSLTLTGPSMGHVPDGTVSVIESNGEALLKLLTAKGLTFKYESSWVPNTEAWISDFYNPPKRDQDEWN